MNDAGLAPVSIKATVARGLGRVAQVAPLRPLMRTLFRQRIAIVFYHGVWPSGSRHVHRFGGVELDAFQRDLTRLRDYFRFAPMEEVIEMDPAALDEPVLAVTFDDCHDMVRGGVLDVLAAAGIRATMFVVTKCIGNRHLMWMHIFSAVVEARGRDRFIAAYNRVVEKAGVGAPIRSMAAMPWSTKSWPMALKDQLAAEIYHACDMPPIDEYLDQHRPYMTWAELEAWQDRGHAVGLHSHSHPFCSVLDATGLEQELTAAARVLRNRLSLKTVPFAYPFGDRIRSRHREHEIAARADLSCMLGVDGLSAPGTEPVALERVDAEAGLDFHLFAKPIRAAVVGALWGRWKPA